MLDTYCGLTRLSQTSEGAFMDDIAYGVLAAGLVFAAALAIAIFFLLRKANERATSALRGKPAAEVVCIAGPDMGKRAAFRAGRVQLGRAASNMLVMDHVSVSSRHAEVVYDDGQFRLEDLESLNGTYVDGARVYQSRLTDGSQFVIGPNTLALVMSGSQLPPAQPPRDTTHAPGSRRITQTAPSLNDYDVEPRAINSGGQADVYRARHRNTGQVVVVKCLKSMPHDEQTRYLRMKFEQQIVHASRFDHPHLVKIFGGDAYPKDYPPYLIEEYLPGGTLYALLQQRGRLSPADTRRYVGQACDGLGYLHARGVIHRDVSPGNMMLDGEGRLRLIDFGIAHFANAPTQTAVGMMIGKARYISPEQARGKSASAQSDLYALGVVAYEMLSGRAPFESEGFKGVEQHLKEPPPPLRALLPDVPPDLESAVMRALTKDPAGRYRDALAMAAAFGVRLAAYPDQRISPPVLTLTHVKTGRALRIREDTVLIRAALDPDDGSISRRHGQVATASGVWWISELDEQASVNGLYVNGLRVSNAEKRALKVGDEIRLGQSVWRVTLDTPA
jgi:serine/threonine protein kinase